LKEPYRVEGKKTLGYELAEQLNWELPDRNYLPDWRRHRMIGMWKAFDEMEQMGWIGAKRPKMVTVQAGGARQSCAPLRRGSALPMSFQAATAASGLRVPKAIGDFFDSRCDPRFGWHGRGRE